MRRPDDRQNGRRRGAEAPGPAPDVIYGRNTVREALAAERGIDKIFIQKGERTGSITMLVAMAKERRIPIVECDKVKLDKVSGGGNHQGIAAQIAETEYVSIGDILAYAAEKGEKSADRPRAGTENKWEVCEMSLAEQLREKGRRQADAGLRDRGGDRRDHKRRSAVSFVQSVRQHGITGELAL